MAGLGLAFGIEGLIRGIHQDSGPDAEPIYLIQIYAGYALLLLLMACFCIACREFKRHKVNFVNILELDGRHHLDWRQLFEIPAMLLLLLGLVMYLNFRQVGGDSFYIYWPVVLIGVTVLILFNPVPILYYRTRKWFLETIWRKFLTSIISVKQMLTTAGVFFSGLYPVEFRDLLFGDMFCSLTYAFGNIELFFCLYAKHWQDPPQCGSGNSMLFGFFSTLPGIFRALQCIRRFWESGDVFPHLANAGKYSFTILSYISLSVFRIHGGDNLMAFLIAASTLNSFYCIVWDIIMDWSLGNPSAKYPFLRDNMLFDHVWWYYTAMVIDPILRFNWIFYPIFTGDVQHSTIVSFLVATSEVLRRGMWSVFRMENEQCANNKRFKAIRLPPIPYDRPEASATTTAEQPTESDARPSPLELRLRRVGSAMVNAHERDYERKKPQNEDDPVPEDDDDEDEDD